MNELLSRLLELLTVEMITNNDYVASIHIMDDITTESLLRINHLPAIIIMSMGEDHTQGPFSNSARETFSLNLVLICRSSNTYAYEVDPLTGTTTNRNIYALTDILKGILYENKKLVSSTFEMTPKFQCIDVRGASQNGTTVRTVMLEYTRLEKYTGMQNEQTPPYIL